MFRQLLVLLWTLQATANLLSSATYSDYATASFCWRYLNGTSSLGCQGRPSFSGSNGVLFRIASSQELDAFGDSQLSDTYIAVISPAMFVRSTLDRLFQQSKLQGVLVPFLEDANATGVFSGFRVPSDYSEGVREKWNSFGRDLRSLAYPFPMAAVDPDDATLQASLRKALEFNLAANYRSYPLYGAQLSSFMYATTDTETCLRRGSGQPRFFCFPAGGSSVFSTATPEGKISSQPVIWVSSIIDSWSLFPGSAFGFNAYQSGVIASLAVADALSRAGNISSFPASVVFTYFDAESWDFSGSRRFVKEILEFNCKNKGPNPNTCHEPFFASTLFSQLPIRNTLAFVEFGQLFGSNSTLYIHSKNASTELSSLFQSNAGSIDLRSVDNAVNGGDIPPSSVMSFLEKLPSFNHLVLQDHEREFSNRFFQSPFDASNFNQNSTLLSLKLCAAASMAAKSVYSIAKAGTLTGGLEPAPPIEANCTLVAELTECFSTNFTCDLVRRFMPVSGFNQKFSRSAYYFYFNIDDKTPNDPGTQAKFISRFLSNAFATERSSSDCRFTLDCPGNQTCSAFKCVSSFTQYHDAYGTGLEFDYGLKRFRISDPKLPAWTMSNADVTAFRIYMTDSLGAQVAQLVGGIFLILLCVVGGLYTKRFMVEKLKIA